MIRRLLDLYRASPPGAPIADEDQVRRTYRYWRLRMMYSAFIGYAVFYFVRKNISIAIPVMESSVGVTKRDLGLFITLGDLLYGGSKFINGMLADRANPRFFMATGLMLSAVINVCFGLSTTSLAFGLLWMINGWFQGMGFPPCARLLSHWYSPGERGTKWAIWNTSHQVGAAVILVLAGYLATWHVRADLPGPWRVDLDGWQLCFVVPALIAAATSLLLVNRLRDTPRSMGLPPVEQYRGEVAVPGPVPGGSAFRDMLVRRVFGRWQIWTICLANFFVYIVRYAFLNWAPSFLTGVKHADIGQAGWMTAGFEIAGLVGSLAAGWITDRFMGSRRAPVCVAYMLATLVSVVVFWKLPSDSLLVNGALLCAVGFFIYGPQFLVGVMTTDLATKHAAATAIGLTGLFGYASSVVSGWGMGFTLDLYGWDGGFKILVASAVLGTALFALVWNARPT